MVPTILSGKTSLRQRYRNLRALVIRALVCMLFPVMIALNAMWEKRVETLISDLMNTRPMLDIIMIGARFLITSKMQITQLIGQVQKLFTPQIGKVIGLQWSPL